MKNVPLKFLAKSQSTHQNAQATAHKSLFQASYPSEMLV